MSDDRLEVILGGHVFRLRAPIEEHDCLKKASNYVNTTMEELRTAGGGPAVVDTTTLALQTAFRISHEYFKLMAGDRPVAAPPSIQEQMVFRLQTIVGQIDELIQVAAKATAKPVTSISSNTMEYVDNASPASYSRLTEIADDSKTDE